jgi:hypothetical protein
MNGDGRMKLYWISSIYFLISILRVNEKDGEKRTNNIMTQWLGWRRERKHRRNDSDDDGKISQRHEMKEAEKF